MIRRRYLLQHVIERCQQAFAGRIVVACCHRRLTTLVHGLGVECILTDPNLPSGSDRAYAAYEQVGKGEQHIIVMQGDMIIFPRDLIQRTLHVFSTGVFDVATAVTPLRFEDRLNDHYVKVAFEPQTVPHENPSYDQTLYGKALYFSRAVIPHNTTDLLKHIGLYIYTANALKRYISGPSSFLEQTEKLEQLRGLSLGFRYGAALVKGDYYSVDTPDDVCIADTFLTTQSAIK
jgi:3-deoxy-manno-octulosonate cytidylyltransferase (CMP-KDO synthetase)